jgi:DNA-binding beta-propeller fold protein YncE
MWEELMRKRTMSVCVAGALVAAVLLLAGPVAAVEGDTMADAVLGQPDFSSVACNNGGISARTLCNPTDIAMDPTSGRLFLADAGNSRVLSWPNTRRFDHSDPADLVLGQPDFTSNTGCVTDARTLCNPEGIGIDRAGRVYVAASLNPGRVLRFSPPFTNGQDADLVLGQPDFTSEGSACGFTPGAIVNARQFCGPIDVVINRAEQVYVTDSDNSRVLRFSPPFGNSQAADLVLGQPDFSSATCNNVSLCFPERLAIGPDETVYVAGGFSRAIRFPSPQSTGQTGDVGLGPTITHGVALDRMGNLFVSGLGQVFRFRQPLAFGQQADQVFGQPIQFDTDCETRPVNASTFCQPRGLEVDFRGDLFVADTFRHRVLRFNQPSVGTQPPTGTRSIGVP